MLISAASGRFPRARLQSLPSLPSLRSVQGLQLVRFPQESPLSATINGVPYQLIAAMEMVLNNEIIECKQYVLISVNPQKSRQTEPFVVRLTQAMPSESERLNGKQQHV